MPALSASAARKGIAAVVAVTVVFGIALFGATNAKADGIGEAGFYDFAGAGCNSNDHTDPIGVLFRGKQAYAANVSRQIIAHTYPAWEHGGWSDHYLRVLTQGGDYECRENNTHNASMSEGPYDRFHVRLWFIPASGPSEYKTVGTPHHEDWVVWNPWNSCGPPGSHAVDQNGSNGSGFDQGRARLRKEFNEAGHAVVDAYWGNTANFTQCDGGEAGSNGTGVSIVVNHRLGAHTRFASTKATLKGTLYPEEATTDWWFAYGPNPAQGAGYPNKTPVRSTSSGIEEMEVSEAVSGLDPNTTYYVRMFARNQDGEVAEGNEVVLGAPPTVETKPVSNLSETQATLNGTVNPNGLETTYRFEYGKTTAYGNSVPIPDGGAGAGTSPVPATIPTNVLPRTRYHYRLVATNAAGTSYGADQAFTTGFKWIVRNSNSAGNPDFSFWFGVPGEKRVVGDWDGNGSQTPGAYNPSTGVWKLRNSATTGPADISFQYGGGPWTNPAVGDWDGNGTTTIGVYDPVAGNWNLRNSNSAGNPNYSFQYGGGPWKNSVAGDWNNDGIDTIGVYDPVAGNWNLRNSNSAGNPNYSFQYGGGPWVNSIAGDWNGDGIDTIGVNDPVAGNWNLRNFNSGGNPDISFQYGGSVYIPVVGDWDSNGTSTPALTEGDAETAIDWHLRNSNSGGNPDLYFEYGSSNQKPIVGDWNGDGIDTVGRYDPASGVWKLRNSNTATQGMPLELANMPVTEPFDGSSESLNNFTSKWSALSWATGTAPKGEDTTSGWRPVSAYSTINGAYYNNTSITDTGSGIAAVATMAANPGIAERYFSLWLDMQTPSGTRSGYELRFTNTATNTYTVKLSKWVSGSETVLASKSTYSFANGDSFAVVDQGGQVSAWTDTGSGFSQLLSAADSAFSSGYVGLHGAGNISRLANFKAGPLATTIEFQYGGGPWVLPVAGDWNGDGIDTIGVYDPVAGNWNLRNSNTAGNPDLSFQYGGGIWETPVVGDWNGDGIDTIGVYDPVAGNWNLRNFNSGGNPDISFQYGSGPWIGAVTGDWDANGTTTIGVYDPVAGNWNLRNFNSGGNPDISFQYGGSQFLPVAGDWDGNGTETVGLVTW